jgi:DNA (cytosine-5)-methyltransferase 1
MTRDVPRHNHDRPRLLDLYCRKGGAAMGYIRAGFDVVGVDIEDHADGYPGTFVQGDAIEYAKQRGHEFAAIHASPPCQGQIAITAGNRARKGWIDNHVNLIPDTREALDAVGQPYVIENGPSEHLRPDLTLCGLTFGLPTFRHRYFELGNWTATPPEHVSHRGHLTVGWRHGCLRTVEPSVCPKHDRWCRGTVYGVYGQGGGKPSVPQAQAALGIDWMTDIDDLNEAIPPAYTEYIGRQLICHLMPQQLGLWPAA